jgi:hypothetical protein
MLGLRVEVVPDDDAEADPDIPKDVLAALGPDTVLAGLNMMYIRASNWERMREQINHRFPLRNVADLPASEWTPHEQVAE